MKNDIVLTTKELADYLKLNEKTILRMAQTGKLPGVKIASQWRFHLSAIDRYLQESVMKPSSDDLDILINPTEDIIPLSRFMDCSLINLGLESEHRDGVLQELAEIANKAGLVPSTKELLEELREREKMLSTAVGSGIAIPHPRSPNPSLFKKTNIIMARSNKGIDFTAPDNKRVHLFFMPCTSNVVAHLKLLAKISKLFRITGITERFMQADNENEVIRILLELERIRVDQKSGTGINDD